MNDEIKSDGPWFEEGDCVLLHGEAPAVVIYADPLEKKIWIQLDGVDSPLEWRKPTELVAYRN